VGTIAVVGGTGPPGKGLGYRFARGGHDVVLGSRAEDRALAAAGELAARLPDRPVIRATNTWAVRAADIVLLAVPFDGQDDLVEELAHELVGKIVVSCVNPLGFDKHGPYGLVSVRRRPRRTRSGSFPTPAWWERSTTEP
jgi:NADPH-dependent F420 reductase